ncbi:aspartic peptidase domain-containing protein [Fusarium flagelliforme]|uniref:aspartic peptidase domain-containing protein n=1 Tax=Fusarium flagelliforme TaxID=2675880 RepID=UPI001E8E5977|nr:aspartic peptidase domain-containing protein [Fusarium flagelliforme]KAH7173695.1 aspartic peptidase domain-containing protein [Fusarium flagelliforme]
MRTLYLVLALVTNILCPALSAAVRSQSGWDLSTPLNGFSFKRAKALAFKPIKSADKVGLYTSRLKSLKSRSEVYPKSSLSLLARPDLQAFSDGNGTVHHQNISAVGSFSTAYAIQCTWDQTPVWLIFDTGSSDTWAAKTGFRCENSVGNKRNQAACEFGQPHIPDFLQDISEVYFHRRYGSGEVVSGPMGISDIACGGVSVSGQQVGLANRAFWHVDESEWNKYPYTPWLTNAISQGLIDPVFSITIDRNTSDGVLAWGGLPPMHWHPKSVASTDLIIAKLVDQDVTAWKPSFYTIIPDGLQWGSTTDMGKYPYVVDTGTTMMYIPPPLAEAIAKAFDPPATYMPQWGSYFVNCKAIPPHFAVIISGVHFWINPADLIYQELIDQSNGKCALAISTGGSGPYILGDVFLQNVVAVFDVGGAEMRFYSRE